MIYSVDRPENRRVVRSFGMIEATTTVGLSEATGIRKLFECWTTTHQDAMNALAAAAPKEANAVVGVRVATACCADSEGRILLLITYIGTPVDLAPAPSFTKTIINSPRADVKAKESRTRGLREQTM